MTDNSLPPRGSMTRLRDWLAFVIVCYLLPTPWRGWKGPIAWWLLPYAGNHAYRE